MAVGDVGLWLNYLIFSRHVRTGETDVGASERRSRRRRSCGKSSTVEWVGSVRTVRWSRPLTGPRLDPRHFNSPRDVAS